MAVLGGMQFLMREVPLQINLDQVDLEEPIDIDLANDRGMINRENWWVHLISVVGACG